MSGVVPDPTNESLPKATYTATATKAKLTIDSATEVGVARTKCGTDGTTFRAWHRHPAFMDQADALDRVRRVAGSNHARENLMGLFDDLIDKEERIRLSPVFTWLGYKIESLDPIRMRGVTNHLWQCELPNTKRLNDVMKIIGENGLTFVDYPGAQYTCREFLEALIEHKILIATHPPHALHDHLDLLLAAWLFMPKDAVDTLIDRVTPFVKRAIAEDSLPSLPEIRMNGNTEFFTPAQQVVVAIQLALDDSVGNIGDYLLFRDSASDSGLVTSLGTPLREMFHPKRLSTMSQMPNFPLGSLSSDDAYSFGTEMHRRLSRAAVTAFKASELGELDSMFDAVPV